MPCACRFLILGHEPAEREDDPRPWHGTRAVEYRTTDWKSSRGTGKSETIWSCGWMKNELSPDVSIDRFFLAKTLGLHLNFPDCQWQHSFEIFAAIMNLRDTKRKSHPKKQSFSFLLKAFLAAISLSLTSSLIPQKWNSSSTRRGANTLRLLRALPSEASSYDETRPRADRNNDMLARDHTGDMSSGRHLIVDTRIPAMAPIVEHKEEESDTVTFYVIGDVPYSDRDAIAIEEQISNLPASGDFLVHVGDLRRASGTSPCQRSEYRLAAGIFSRSPIPVLVLLGDNDWNDCRNPDQGLGVWREQFVNFENKYWDFPYEVTRMSGPRETFAFQAKGFLFVGLQLVGGKVLDDDEWETRLIRQARWVKTLITDYRNTLGRGAFGRVVIFAHANPTRKHRSFFDPLVDFIEHELRNEIPILYVNGDGHSWDYRPLFYGQSSFLRIMVTGGSSEPPLKVSVSGGGKDTDPARVFSYDRQLL